MFPLGLSQLSLYALVSSSSPKTCMLGHSDRGLDGPVSDPQVIGSHQGKVCILQPAGEQLLEVTDSHQCEFHSNKQKMLHQNSPCDSSLAGCCIDCEKFHDSLESKCRLVADKVARRIYGVAPSLGPVSCGGSHQPPATTRQPLVETIALQIDGDSSLCLSKQSLIQ